MQIGKTSIHCIHDSLTANQSAALAQRVEAAGYGALWIAETFGREVFAHAAHLLASTTRLVVGSGIANIYARDPKAMRAGQLALSEQSEGRFLLGLGVSHSLIVSDMRGHVYGKPVTTMRTYLEAMEAQNYTAPMPAERAPTLLAALRPKMLELAATAADGAIPVWTSPEHTARARAIMGPDKLLCPLQYVLLESDPVKARAAARKHSALSMSLPNYQENLKWLGFESDDFENGCSDRLIDTLIAWGDERVIRTRIAEHFSAGADHVCIGPLHPDPRTMMDIDMRLIELLAPGNA